VSFQLLSQTPGVNLINHVRFAVRSGEEVHNAYLSSLAQLGPLGFVLFLGILWVTARALLDLSRRARGRGDWQIRRVSNALMISLSAFAVSSLLLSTETSRALWLVVGLSLALPGIALQDQLPAERPSPETLQGTPPTADID
jgi:O-antigen ligase